MADDLTIKLKLDRSLAEQSSKEFHQAEKQRIAESVSEHTQAERAKARTTQEASRDRTKAAVDAARAETEATKETTEATLGLGRSVSSLVGSFGVVQIAGQVFGAVTSAVDGTAARVQELTKDFLRQRDALRELGGVLGQPANIQLTQEQLRFAATAGMTPDEARQFRSTFQGEAQQYKGKFTSLQEYNEYESDLAKYAVQMGLAPDVAARLGGAVVRAGDQGITSEEALKVLGQSFGTMQQGSGENQTLAQMLTQTVGAMVGPNNAFKTVQEAAVGVRTMAESGNAAEAFTELQAIRSGILQLKPEEMQALGIDAKTGFFDAMRQINEKTRSAVAAGSTQDEFLRKYFPDIRTQRGLQIMLNQGLGNDVIGKGFADASKVGLGDVESGIASFFADPSQAGMLRQAQGQRTAAESALAQNRALISPYLEEARAQMAPELADPRRQFGYAIQDAFTKGPRMFAGISLGGAESNVYMQAAANIQDRLDAAGVQYRPLSQWDTNGPTAALEQRLAEMVELLREANRQRAMGTTSQASWEPIAATPAAVPPSPTSQASW